MRPERPNLRPERPDVGGIDERTDIIMNEHFDSEKVFLGGNLERKSTLEHKDNLFYLFVCLSVCEVFTPLVSNQV